MAITEVDLYYRVEARITNLGILGPKKPVKVAKNLADLLIKKDPNFSLKPFNDPIQITQTINEGKQDE